MAYAFLNRSVPPAQGALCITPVCVLLPTLGRGDRERERHKAYQSECTQPSNTGQFRILSPCFWRQSNCLTGRVR